MLPILLYYIALPFIYLIALLPFRIMYIISYGIFFVLYRLIGYRKKVVFENLQRSFPEKTKEEIEKIAIAFYQHLCDMMLETFKTLVISPKEMLLRCRISENAQTLFNQYNDKQQSIILAMGHHGNWEWGGNSFSLACAQQLHVIYHPLSNPQFDKLMINMRTRFGTKLIPMNDTFKAMVKNRKEVTATAFIADQSPSPTNAHWTNFLQQDTPFFLGMERIGGKMNYPIVYIFIKKIKRGYYELEATTLIENPKDLSEGIITETYVRQLEKDIRQHPETWLWSHRRWKHKRSK